MSIGSFTRKVFGQVVLEKVNSAFNGEIYVTKDFLGEKRILIGGLTQSGRIIEKIWDKVLKQLEKKPSKVLILGFGGGGAARVINKRFPKAKITALEIDPEIVKLAKKYFEVKRIKNLKLIVDDASSWIKTAKEKFDLVLVDIYCGEEIPRSCQKETFFKNIKRLLVPSGTAIFNHLYGGEDIKRAEKFKAKLEKVFFQVTGSRAVANILFKAKKE